MSQISEIIDPRKPYPYKTEHNTSFIKTHFAIKVAKPVRLVKILAKFKSQKISFSYKVLDIRRVNLSPSESIGFVRLEKLTPFLKSKKSWTPHFNYHMLNLLQSFHYIFVLIHCDYWILLFLCFLAITKVFDIEKIGVASNCETMDYVQGTNPETGHRKITNMSTTSITSNNNVSVCSNVVYPPFNPKTCFASC